jgi:hypothetical protein
MGNCLFTLLEIYWRIVETVAEKAMRPASTASGYLRVSMPNQNLEKNKADILQLANQQNLSLVRVRRKNSTCNFRADFRFLVAL